MARYRNFLDSLVGEFRDFRAYHRLNEHSKATIIIEFNSERDKYEFMSAIRHDTDPADPVYGRSPPFYGIDVETVQGVDVVLKSKERMAWPK